MARSSNHLSAHVKQLSSDDLGARPLESRKSISTTDLIDFMVMCRTSPSDRVLELVRTHLREDLRDIPSELLRASISAAPGMEPQEAPGHTTEPAFLALFDAPQNGLGDIARDHFDVDTSVLPDQAIRILYLRGIGVEIPAQDRTKGAFRRVEDDFRLHFLETVRGNWAKAEAELSRNVIISLVLLLMFELLKESAVSKFTLAGLEVEDLSVTIRLLPVVVAYLCFRTTTTHQAIGEYREIYDAAIEELYPDFYSRDLETYMGPGQTNIWHAASWFVLSNDYSRRSQVIFERIQSWISVAIVLAPVPVVTYMYWVVVDRFGFWSLLTLVSVLASLVFFALAFAFLLGSTNSTEPDV